MEKDLPGYFLHLPDDFPELAFVLNGGLPGFKLLPTEGDGHRFLSDFACPLITAASTLDGGSVDGGALADIADGCQSLTEVVVLAFPS